MVDVIDLVDDSSDDDDEQQTAQLQASASRRIATIRSTSQKTKPQTVYRSIDNNEDDSDIEVLFVDPLPPRSKALKAYPKKPSTAPISRLSLSDSEDEDDDISFSKLSPSGLSKKSLLLQKPGKSPIESYMQGGNPTPLINIYTPKTPRSGQISLNSASVKKKIYNPYAKKKTPPSSTSSMTKPTGKTSSWKVYSASSHVDLVSPVAARSQKIIRNPYSSGGKKSKAVERAFECDLSAPKLRSTTKTYPDLRPNIVLALWKYARMKLVRDSFQRPRLDQFIGRIVDLAVAAPDFPIRSIGEYAIRKRGHMSKRGTGGVNITGDALQRFDDDLSSTKMMNTRFPRIPGLYFSIAEACLVAMKEIIYLRWQSKQKESQSSPLAFPANEAAQRALFSQKDYYISLADLIPQIDRRLRPECPSKLGRKPDADQGVSYYLNKSTRSAEFKQIEKLLAPVDVPNSGGSIETTSYIKKRMVGGKQHYQLMPLGFQKALQISRRCFLGPPGPYRFCNIRSVQPKYAGICLAVDFREGGGGDKFHKGLHKMCNKLDMRKIPYCVNTLKIGDYCFFFGDKLCPILIERKTVEDVAKSIDIGDGRWVTQKERMYHGQYVFGYQNCRMAYIIEGNVEKHLVSNNFVANCRHKVSKDRFEDEIANLESEGFEVLRTYSVEDSMRELCRWAESAVEDVRRKRLKLKYTYDEFVEKVKAIPKDLDFSGMAKKHSKRRLESVVDLMSDGEGKILSPVILDELLRKAEKRKKFEISSGANATKRLKLEECKEILARRLVGNGSSPSIASALAPLKVSRVYPIQSNSSETQYTKWTVNALRDECVKLGMKKSGSKTQLIDRLMDPANRPPPVYRLRKERKLYVPLNLDTAPTAILVAIQIAQDSAGVGPKSYMGSTKDEIIHMCQELEITKNPFCGGTTQTGPYRYDGWSSMRYLKKSGDPPLVVEKKQRFRLSMTGDVCGLKFAREMHIWCHKRGICKCVELGYDYDPTTWK